MGGQHVALVLCMLAAGAGAFIAGKYVRAPTATEIDLEQRLEVAETKLTKLVKENADLKAQVVDQGTKLDKLHEASRTNFSVIVASLERLKPGTKLEWEGGAPPIDVEFHAAPMRGSSAPAVQPRAQLVPP